MSRREIAFYLYTTKKASHCSDPVTVLWAFTSSVSSDHQIFSTHYTAALGLAVGQYVMILEHPAAVARPLMGFIDQHGGISLVQDTAVGRNSNARSVLYIWVDVDVSQCRPY